MLSFFAFCCCCRNKTASEALKKKNLTFRKKKIFGKAQRFFLVLRHQFQLRSHSPDSIIGTKTAANQSRPKEELAFFLLKNDERNVHLSFSDGFLERNSRKDEKDARARKMISKPRIINFNQKPTEK